MNWKNIAERAAWTFLEGFLVALPAASGLGLDAAAWKAALLGALMAGLSAVKTLAIELLQARG
ncbi:MAG: hypothetical protein IJB09_04675 [Oscillospiraceae bacterium]|nr:hypothetical protein [Oscillospiraceae bacterium]